MLLHAFQTYRCYSAARRSVAPRAHGDDQQLYAVLGVPSSASQQEIKSAYKRLVHSLHPDKHQQAHVDTTEEFLRCKAAYEVLINEQLRSKYDQQLEAVANSCQEQDMQQHQWNPYNATMADSRPCSHASAQPSSDPASAAAAAAAAVSSSGLSAYALRQRRGGRQQLCGSPTGPGGPAAADAWDSLPGERAAVGAELRSVLLSQHGVAMEQFGSLQEALEYLEQQDQQDSLVGLAAEDYSNRHEKRVKMRQHRQNGQHPGMYVRRSSSSSSSSGRIA